MIERDFEKLLYILHEHGLLIETSVCDPVDFRLSHLTANSKDVAFGTFYICKGASFKKDYLISAKKNGAELYMSERIYPEADMPYIIVSDVRRAMALAARWFYGCPGDLMPKAGVTGTKGKTTVTFVIRDILNLHTHGRCAAFSTHAIDIGADTFETNLTTPEPIELQSYFAAARKKGCTRTVMEVSSQAMKMNRIYGESYRVGVFTNIDCDHISPTEHSSMEDYLACKIAFLKQCENVVLYAGAKYFREIYEAVCDRHVVVYGDAETIRGILKYIHNIPDNMHSTPDDMHDIPDNMHGILESALDTPNKVTDGSTKSTEFATICVQELNADGSRFSVIYGGKKHRYETNLIGDYNVENATAAIVAARLLGVPHKTICAAIKDVFVPGRLQLYRHDGAMFMIDYAHNYLSMYRLYQMVESAIKPKSVTAVFGCGGERCKRRREDMGRLAEQHADRVILTMEDPGFESCEDICTEIRQYITKPCEIIVDREAAVRRALDTAKPGELVIITGKGVETTQRIRGQFVKCHSDAQVIEQWLAEQPPKSCT